jgi:hypothetical protein
MGQPSAVGLEIIPLTDTRKVYPGDVVTLRFRAFQDGTPLANATISRLVLRQETEVLAFGNVTTDGLGDFAFQHTFHAPGGWEQLRICAWNATWHRSWASVSFSGERYQEPPSERIRIAIEPEPLGEPMHFRISLDSNVPSGGEYHFQLSLTPTTDIHTDLGTYWARDLVSGTTPGVFYRIDSTRAEGNITVPYWFPEGTYTVHAFFLVWPNASIGAEYLSDWNSTTVPWVHGNRLPPSIPDTNADGEPTRGFTTTFIPGLETTAAIVALALSSRGAWRRRAS